MSDLLDSYYMKKMFIKNNIKDVYVDAVKIIGDDIVSSDIQIEDIENAFKNILMRKKIDK